MILYFDTFVTDLPLFPNKKMDDLMRVMRPYNSIYRNPTKLEIFRYTLESFLDLKFDKIVLNVEFEKDCDKEFFNNIYTENDTIIISNKRCDSKHDYLESLSCFGEDEWCFFSPNNDHPYVANDSEILNRLEQQANIFSSKYNSNVTIFYSHYTENINIIDSTKYLNSFYSDKVTLLEETDDCYVVKFTNLQYASIQILRVGFLKDLFMKVPDNSSRLIRLEDIAKYISESIPVISLIPKTEICRHFDTYIHTIFHYFKYIKPTSVPPLFIPEGYFDRNIKIQYGFNTICKDKININPNKSIYSFKDPQNGYDLLCRLEDLPISWKKRISDIDVSNDFILTENFIILGNKIKNPWGNLNIFQILFYKYMRRLFNSNLYKLILIISNKLFWRYKLSQVIK